MRPLIVSISMVTAIAMVLFSSSCSMVGKTEPERMPPPASAYLLPATPGEADALSTRLARVVEGMTGVKHATVILTHTTAIVGLELYSVADEEELFKKVAACLEKQDARIHTVRVTAKPETVKRIKHVAHEIRAGKTVNGFSGEIVDIMRETAPVRL